MQMRIILKFRKRLALLVILKNIKQLSSDFCFNGIGLVSKKCHFIEN
jgi:hypothetical protein